MPTRPKSTAAPGPRRLPVLLRHAWYGLNQAFRRRIAHTGLTPDQYTVLRTLSEADPPGLTQSELTRRMASDANTIASLLERMEGGGLIQRRVHEKDARARCIELLPKGREKQQQACEIAASLQAEVLGCLPERRIPQFLANLDEVAHACRGALEKSAKARRAPPAVLPQSRTAKPAGPTDQSST